MGVTCVTLALLLKEWLLVMNISLPLIVLLILLETNLSQLLLISDYRLLILLLLLLLLRHLPSIQLQPLLHQCRFQLHLLVQQHLLVMRKTMMILFSHLHLAHHLCLPTMMTMRHSAQPPIHTLARLNSHPNSMMMTMSHLVLHRQEALFFHSLLYSSLLSPSLF